LFKLGIITARAFAFRFYCLFFLHPTSPLHKIEVTTIASEWITGRRNGGASPLAVSGAVESTCRQAQCRSSDWGNIGVTQETKLSFVWKPSGVTVAGICSFPITGDPTSPKTEMRLCNSAARFSTS
jgi:hypothetical protein